MATEVLHTLPMDEGLQIEVAKIDRGFSVILRDTDAGEVYPVAAILPTEEKALAWARAQMTPGPIWIPA